jgi:hypothetical protein
MIGNVIPAKKRTTNIIRAMRRRGREKGQRRRKPHMPFIRARRGKKAIELTNIFVDG